MRRLRLALRAYPRRVRDAEGDVLLGLAQDLADGPSSVTREAAGLVRGGLVLRAGALAQAPWDGALARLAVPLAVAFTALIWGRGALALSSSLPDWPGWSWVVTLTAPVLALAGVLAGRRAPAVIGALMLVLISVAQGNNRPGTTTSWFTGYVEWTEQGSLVVGYAIAGLGCAIPGALILLAAAVRLPHTGGRHRWIVTIAWAAVGAVGVFLLGDRRVTVAGLLLDDLSLALLTYGVAVAGFAAVVLAGPARRDPAWLLAVLLAGVSTAPTVALYGLGSVPVVDASYLLFLVVVALGGGAAFLRAAAATARS